MQARQRKAVLHLPSRARTGEFGKRAALIRSCISGCSQAFRPHITASRQLSLSLNKGKFLLDVTSCTCIRDSLVVGTVGL
jgi:hypothetical protein